MWMGHNLVNACVLILYVSGSVIPILICKKQAPKYFKNLIMYFLFFWIYWKHLMTSGWQTTT